jgi:hypothetical protein
VCKALIFEKILQLANFLIFKGRRGKMTLAFERYFFPDYKLQGKHNGKKKRHYSFFLVFLNEKTRKKIDFRAIVSVLLCLHAFCSR